ncbi:MAG: ABC transporter substrate-binding protein [Thermoleophilia bacterium]
MAGVISACSGSTTTTTAGTTATTTAGTTPTTAASAGTIKIGFISPRTGPAASFGESDGYVLELARKAFASGISVGDKTYAVEIIDKDGQTNPQQGAALAQELITREKIDLMLATSTPETTNPVADACEAAGVPCVTTTVPWEAWYFGRGGTADKPSPFKYTYHFSYGTHEFFQSYTTTWEQLPTNKVVGVMLPNDADGNAMRAAFVPLLTEAGYTVVDPGAYENFTNDFSGLINTYIEKDCQILNSLAIPPDFAVFWRQAAQLGYKPKIVQSGKSGLFPSDIEALGELGYKLSSAAFFANIFPYKSSLTGETAQQICDGYQKATSKPYNPQLGPSMALFDVAKAALVASNDPFDKTAVAEAMKTLEVETPIGMLKWGTFFVPNVVPTVVVNGQWVKGTGEYPVDWVCVENSLDPKIPTAGQLVPVS